MTYYYKVMQEDETYNGRPFTDGRNVLLDSEHFAGKSEGDWAKGGFYFTDRDNLWRFLDDGPWVVEVTLPYLHPDLRKVSSSHTPPRHYRANMIELGKRWKLHDPRILTLPVGSRLSIWHIFQCATDTQDPELIRKLIPDLPHEISKDDCPTRYASLPRHIRSQMLIKDALCLAAKKGHLDCVKDLLAGGNGNGIPLPTSSHDFQDILMAAFHTFQGATTIHDHIIDYLVQQRCVGPTHFKDLYVWAQKYKYKHIMKWIEDHGYIGYIPMDQIVERIEVWIGNDLIDVKTFGK